MPSAEAGLFLHFLEGAIEDAWDVMVDTLPEGAPIDRAQAQALSKPIPGSPGRVAYRVAGPRPHVARMPSLPPFSDPAVAAFATRPRSISITTEA